MGTSERKTLSEPPSVLVVEDEYFLAADLERALTDAGFVTDVVWSGEEALTLLIGDTITHRALVTDVCLRGSVSGWELARCIRERQPAFPVVYVTSASADEWASRGVPNSILISKPFAEAKLVTAVVNLLTATPRGDAHMSDDPDPGRKPFFAVPFPQGDCVMDYAMEAERHRHMAEEYRTMADCAIEDELRVHYRKLAEVYDGLADNEARVASNIKLSS